MRTKKSNILYVDHDFTNTIIFKGLFDSYHNIFIAESATEGYNTIEENPIDLVITNQKIPNMSGLEFLQKAKQKWPWIKSILLSPHSDMEVGKSVIQDIKILHYLNNPFDQIEMKLLIDWAVELSITEIEEQRVANLVLGETDRFHTTFSSICDVFIRINKNGFVDICSPSIYDLFDYQSEKEIGKKIEDNYENNENRKKLLQKINETGFCRN